MPSLYGINAMWFSAAAYYFTFKGRGIIREMSHYPYNKNAALETEYLLDMLRFLGLMNTTLVTLGIICLYKYYKSKNNGNDDTDDYRKWEYMLLFGVANMSQFIGDIKIIRDGKIKPKFLWTITAGDGVLGFIDLYLAVMLYKMLKKRQSL